MEKSDRDMGYDIVVYEFNWTKTNWKKWIKMGDLHGMWGEC